VEAHFGLIGLQQIFEKFAHTNNALRVRRYCLEVANVFAIESPENKVNFFLLV
jgi:hypothetical protein